MAAQASMTPPLSSGSNHLSACWKVTGKGVKGLSPLAPRSDPGLSRDSSVSSAVVRKVSRQVVPGLPRTKTFKRQKSEDRTKLEEYLPTPAERRAVSVDRRIRLERSASRSSYPLPRASIDDISEVAELSADNLAALSQATSTYQTPPDEQHFLNPDEIDIHDMVRGDDHEDEQPHTYPDAISIADTASQYDAMVRDELESKWILNLSMHFRDRSKREKFFVTYREKDKIWRRVTVSLDYRDAPRDSLERDLLATKYQRDKSAKIYEAIRESLQDIQFYDTVTNLKLQTSDGRLHVHVVEDTQEVIQFPEVRLVRHLGCSRFGESQLEFDSHMSGFVYKVRVGGHTFIKKEIPGPDTIDEFLYEVNALNSLRFSQNVIRFHGLVVDDDDLVVKGLLISYAEKGALIDIIIDLNEHRQELPWTTREKWARQIVQGLADIHETGYVQGDFTLSNIVIDEFGNAKIIDINRRGCPIGWEPPEAIPLIENSLRISMYIGVKSDLYQLGMVLWSLATLIDVPENHRPLELNPELDVPQWYRDVVEICLHEKPQDRLQATTLLDRFPEAPYQSMDEEPESPSIPMPNGDSFADYMTHSHHRLPEIRTLMPRDSSPCTSASDTRATSPSFSDELYEPPRGRSPARPLPNHHELYPSPYIDGDAAWGKTHDKTVGEEAGIGMPTDIERATDYDGMGEDLDQMMAGFQTGTDLENEPFQATGGDNSAQEISMKITFEGRREADSQDEEFFSMSEDEVAPTPAYNETPDKPDKLECAPENSSSTKHISQADNRDTPTDTQNDNSGAAYTYDRTDDEASDIATRPIEATLMTPRGSSLSVEAPERSSSSPIEEELGKPSSPLHADIYPHSPSTKLGGDPGVTT